MTPDDLRALLDAASKATPGPWEPDGDRVLRIENGCGISVCKTWPAYNAPFIAAASPDVVASLARIALAAQKLYGSNDSVAWLELGNALFKGGLLTTSPQELK